MLKDCQGDVRSAHGGIRMKKLFAQIMKFGMVGVICFVIDYLIGIAVLNIILKLGGDQYFEFASMALRFL